MKVGNFVQGRNVLIQSLGKVVVKVGIRVGGGRKVRYFVNLVIGQKYDSDFFFMIWVFFRFCKCFFIDFFMGEVRFFRLKKVYMKRQIYLYVFSINIFVFLVILIVGCFELVGGIKRGRFI